MGLRGLTGIFMNSSNSNTGYETDAGRERMIRMNMRYVFEVVNRRNDKGRASELEDGKYLVHFLATSY